MRCTYQVNSGVWYYEVTVLTNGIMQIGFATKLSKFLNYNGYGIGDDGYSVGYDGCRRLVWHNAESQAHEHQAWHEGDVVGFLLDIDSETIIFSLNGAQLSTPHKTIFNEAKTGFFAAASFMSFQHALFNFGREPFKYPPKIKFSTFNDFGSLLDSEKIILPRKVKLDNLRKTTINEENCTLCYDNMANVVLKPCNHSGYCETCIKRLSTCPICRSDIESIEKPN